MLYIISAVAVISLQQLFSDVSDSQPQPLVSIIIATYNRANVLRYAIESVRWQTWTDWELLVIGDACTDDTESVVGGFKDTRISFFNLPGNAGDQSGPNNEGFQRSRGRFVAYLNHDDLWFPDHLEMALKALRETGAGLVWPLIVKLRTDGVFTCNDLNPERRYAAYLSVPASFWVLRRELVEEVGPWRHHSQCFASPSQDWLYRAACAGKDLRYIPHLTAIALPSGGRPRAYANREYLENQTIFERMKTEANFRESVLIGIAEYYSIQQANPPVWDSVKRTWRDFVRRRLAPYWGWPRGSYTSALRISTEKRLRRAVSAAGAHPESWELFLKFGRRGNFIRFLRKFRGLLAGSNARQ
jgi:glycosyltransferase involved in cell wall biosynthesis